MGSGIASLEERRWMRGKRSTGAASSPTSTGFAERHYSVSEIAEIWNLSHDAVRKIFQDEPGVLVLGDHEARNKRRYTTLRIPESVVARVHQRLSNV